MSKILNLIKKEELLNEDISRALGISVGKLLTKIEKYDFTLGEADILSWIFGCKIEDLLPDEYVLSLDNNDEIDIPIPKYQGDISEIPIDEDGYITVYKYHKYGEHTKDIILNERILMSYAKDLNDPFETLAFQTIEGIVAMSIDVSGCAIGSFSLTFDNPMMWALYCGNHEGIVVEIKINPDILKGDGYLIGKVNYSDETPNFEGKPFEPFSDNPKGYETLAKAMFSKNNVWAAEKEFRVIKLIKYPIVCDNEMHLYYSDGEFGKSSNPKVFLTKLKITKIILGHNLTYSPSLKIKSWAKQKNIPTVKAFVDIFSGKIKLPEES